MAAAALLLIIGIFYVKNNVLFGDDKKAYDMIVEAADNFRNPSSVRLVSGTLGVDKDCLFVGISATNGFGARGTEYYFISDDGWILEEDSPASYYKDKDDLNIEKINKRLAATLGDD